MRRVLACAFLLLAGPAWASADGDRRAIVALEQRWLAHIADPAVLEDILADDFVHPLSDGAVIGKAEQVAWARSHPTPPGRTARFEKLDVRIYGRTAIATGLVEAREPGRAGPRRTLFTDVFVERGGRWRAVNAQENLVPDRP